MNTIGWLDTALLVAATGADAVFLWAYTAGNRWWSSRVGRALVGLGTGIGLILGYAALKRVFGWATIPWLQATLYGLVVVILVVLAATFVRERQLWRRAGQRSHHDRADA